VERLMREAGLQGAFMRKRRRSSTRRDPKATPAPDLVNRDFKVDAPNRLWVADISRIATGEGPLWLASVRDAFSRRVVGWKASDRADTELVLGALEMRCGAATSSGSGWYSTPTTARSTPRSGSPSGSRMPARARPWAAWATACDNALAENFFSSLKVERVYRTTYRTREEAELDLVRWIDGWYNPRRIQRELGWLSPDEYEEAYYRSEPSGTLASPAGAR